MDFCAGIGCWRLGLELAWFQCLAFSEIDKKAEITYRNFFGEEENNFWDLMEIDTDKLPDFDMLIAWFPCQTFSIIGQRSGMEDPRWQVIFGIAKILKDKNVKYFLLENVKWLVNHNGWETIKNIVQLLDELWYNVSWKVLNSSDYGLPQSRERVYFAWVKKDLGKFDFTFPTKKKKEVLKKYLIETSDKYILNEKRLARLKEYLNNKYNKWKYTIEELAKLDWYIIDTRQSDIRLYHDISPTLRKWRHWLLYSKNGKLRDISGIEGILLQWIPLEIAIKTRWKVSDNDLLSQAGNAMSVNVIWAIWKQFRKFILWHKSNDRLGRTLITNSKKKIFRLFL